jgi:hypothetical protein
MKRFRACFLAASLAFIFGLTVDSFNPNTIARNEVLELTHKLNEALLKNDQCFLSEIHADDIYLNVNERERTETKKEFLNNLNSSPLNLKSIQTFFVFVEVNENEAKVSYRLTATFKFDDGEDGEFYGSETLIFEKQQGEWKIVSIYVQRL